MKLFVTWRALQSRRVRLPLFIEGSYVALDVAGDRARHLVAFARLRGRDASITVAPRLCYSLSGSDRAPVGADVWGDTSLVLPAGSATGWRCAISGERVAAERRGESVVLDVAAVLNHFPVAVLENEWAG